MTEHDYLFDKQGEPDPEIVRLEQLLGRFAHGQRAARSPRARWLWLLPLPLLAAAGIAALLWWRQEPPPPMRTFDVVRERGGAVGEDGWIEARHEPERLTVTNVGWMTLGAGGRLRVTRLDGEEGRFYLEQGNLEAFVLPTVRPRFFQVETAATTCVDLGCKYVLDVDPETKIAHVRVTLGQVAFTEGEREILVPRDAECTAVPGHGVGTPRFIECAEDLRRSLDAFDAATSPDDRRRAADDVVQAARTPRDSLPLWHLLADADVEVRGRAEAKLVALVSAPADGRSIEAWREHLEPHWW